LRQYRADFDEKAKTFKDRPRHDWTSHSADAFRYMAMAYREVEAELLVRKAPPVLLTELTLDELWDMQDRPTRMVRV
jgi:hypothetical protein